MPIAHTEVRHSRTTPVFARALRVIGDSALDKSEKAVLRAMLQWWNPRSGELWPAMRSIADATGFTIRGTQKIVRRLESKGALLRLFQPSSRARSGAMSRTNVYRILFDQLARPHVDHAPSHAKPEAIENPRAITPPATCSCDPSFVRTTCEETILKNESFSFRDERRTPAPRTAHSANPEPNSSEASKHEAPNERHTSPSAKPPEDSSLRPWMDAPSLAPDRHSSFTELLRAGVRGKLLHELAANELVSPEVIRRELSDARRDWKCRNTTAVLVSRLASIAGIPLKRREDLTRDQMRFKALIERKRREFGIQI